MTKTLLPLTVALLLCACSGQTDTPPDAPAQTTETVSAQPEPAQAEPAQAEPAPDRLLTVEAINPNLHVIFGRGGNVGVSSGADGVVLVDDKFAANTAEILAHVAEITQANGGANDLLFVINTHYHADHAGGNQGMAEAGALVMAHDNVRERMNMRFFNYTFDRMTEPVDEALWPVVTFSDRTTLHFNNETAHAIHTDPGHTDGDAVVHFVDSNAVHMGDVLFYGMFPVVDIDAGGSLQGMIAAHDRVLDMIDADTVVIPGHGPLTNASGLRDTRDALQAVLDRVRVRKEAGEGLDDIIAADPLADMADMDGFITRPAIITAAWRSLGGALPETE